MASFHILLYGYNRNIVFLSSSFSFLIDRQV
nr:MAG TPA: hypothetical protein [Herelleviridae sp.]